jgi:hypothetical protein
MAGIILDQAPRADLLSIDVETNCRSWHGTIADAIHQAVDSGAAIIVVAWSVSAANESIAEAIAYAEAHDSTVVLSEGLESMTLLAPSLDGGYSWYKGTSVTVAWMAGKLARQLAVASIYLPVVGRQ